MSKYLDGWMRPCSFYRFWMQGPRTTDAKWRLFLAKSKIFGLGQINVWAFVVFLADLSAPILVHWVPCFRLINHYVYKKTTLESRINIRVRLLISEVFSRGYVLIKEGYVYWFLIFQKLFKDFQLSFPLAEYKRVKLSAF